MRCFEDYATNIMRWKYDELQFSQSWLTYKEPGQFHKAHSHPNSLLAGVFYYDSIGHVNGTGFRIQQEGGALITDEKVHGFTFKQTSGYTYTSGNLNLYQLDFDQIKMVDNV